MSRERRAAPEPLPCPLPAAEARATETTVEEAAPLAGDAASARLSPSGEPVRDEVRILTPRTGWVIGVEQGRLLVDYPGNRRGPLPARTTVALDARGALSAAAARQGALLVFEDGDPAQPVLIGLVQPPVTTLIDLVLEASDSGYRGDGADATPRDAPPSAEPGKDATGAQNTAATVDGKRLVIEGEEEVTLRCGQASISLRRDGRVVVRGAYVETHASGTNRIKGGSVQIN